MSAKTYNECDFCGVEIDLEPCATATRLVFYPATPPSIGLAFDEHELCPACTEKVFEAFPKLKEALRLIVPVPTPVPGTFMPPELDTITPEQLIALFAKKLGVQVAEVPDDPTKK